MAFADPILLLPPLPRSYTREEALAELDRIYAELPALVCKGLCHGSCTVVAVSELEYQRITDAGASIGPRMSRSRARELAAAGGTVRCPALGPVNNCTIYPIRPFICRAYGVAEGLRCPHGCMPEKILPDKEIWEKVARIEQLSRYVTGVRAWPVQ